MREDSLSTADDLQPNKRRRTTSVSGSLSDSQPDIYRRIESRQPIARMRGTTPKHFHLAA